MGILSSIFGKNEELEKALEQKGAIVDVRTPGEFAGGNVKGSINIPLNSIENKLNDFKKLNGPVILCCASGNRSGQATRFLKAQGIDCVNGGSWHSVNSKI